MLHVLSSLFECPRFYVRPQLVAAAAVKANRAAVEPSTAPPRRSASTVAPSSKPQATIPRPSRSCRASGDSAAASRASSWEAPPSIPAGRLNGGWARRSGSIGGERGTGGSGGIRASIDSAAGSVVPEDSYGQSFAPISAAEGGDDSVLGEILAANYATNAEDGGSNDIGGDSSMKNGEIAGTDAFLAPPQEESEVLATESRTSSIAGDSMDISLTQQEASRPEGIHKVMDIDLVTPVVATVASVPAEEVTPNAGRIVPVNRESGGTLARRSPSREDVIKARWQGAERNSSSLEGEGLDWRVETGRSGDTKLEGEGGRHVRSRSRSGSIIENEGLLVSSAGEDTLSMKALLRLFCSVCCR